jgi:4-hydroxysphinganine ceramide fatty acyl 2-hydroxylase
MSKRVHIFTASDVATHNSASSCWISRAGKVYDVTHFLQDHPGGDDLILEYAGQDVEEVMRNKDEHEHSEAAYEMLQEYLVGRIGSEETTVSEGRFDVCQASFCLNSFRCLDRLGSHG